ncbi:unnamed protein product [Haemonchus placei]|uniref:50S ribosomal protein L18 n=1 Tax=Haemonchus placei TaxID=6290 RepID=A0A0N4XB25_HAEPC|nr:unnamed protein product [Haemonchus placei]
MVRPASRNATLRKKARMRTRKRRLLARSLRPMQKGKAPQRQPHQSVRRRVAVTGRGKTRRSVHLRAIDVTAVRDAFSH